MTYLSILGFFRFIQRVTNTREFSPAANPFILPWLSTITIDIFVAIPIKCSFRQLTDLAEQFRHNTLAGINFSSSSSSISAL